MKVIVNSDYSGVDEIINSVDNLLVKNSFNTEMSSSEIVFLRKTDKRHNKIMPLLELANGINEGKLTVQQVNGKVIISCQFKWYLHSFATILLTAAFFLIFYTFSNFNYILDKLLIAALIVFPLSIIGVFVSKRHFRNIILKALRKTGLSNNLIESS